MNFFATTPKGLELLLVEELKTLGAIAPAEKLAGVKFSGDLSVAYRACLWSRLANRILVQLKEFPASTPEELYAGVQNIAWEEHMHPDSTISINFVSSHSNITHTLFGAQKVKDAIVDQFREKFNQRPNVEKVNPDISIHVYLNRNNASISLDLSGESLHKRGYRQEGGSAPLKENLAAAILLRSGWKKISEEGGTLLDPMCGSGTILIEGALIATNTAPGLLRNYFGFLKWKQHDANLWKNIVAEAQAQRIEKTPKIIGFDADPNAIKIAFANIERAGLRGKIHVEKSPLANSVLKFGGEGFKSGLVLTNPPYGERLGEIAELQKLYETLGTKLKTEFVGWQAGVFTGNPDLGKNMGIRSRKNYALFNGAIPCQLLLFDVQQEYFVDRSPAANNERRIRKAQKVLTEKENELAQMFANRIRKNIKHLKKWRDKENISCYRIYDADLPEYAVVVDCYEDKICVDEYQAPKNVDKQKAANRLQQVLAVLPEATNVPPAKIFLREANQNYDLMSVKEAGNQFLLNLFDDSFPIGLPLHQRMLRVMIEKEVENKNFLNLYCDTGTMGISAGRGKAATIKLVAESDFYLQWTKKNIELNGLSARLVETEIDEWIQKEKLRYDIIFADLPIKSFYVRQELPKITQDMVNLLTPGGVLYLTGDIKLPEQLFEIFVIEDITQKIVPPDFARHPKKCQTWKITKKV